MTQLGNINTTSDVPETGITNTWTANQSHVADILPSTTNARDLGSSGLRWAEIWSRIVVGVDGAGTITFTGAQGGGMFGRCTGVGSSTMQLGGGALPAVGMFGNVYTGSATHAAAMRNQGGGSFMAGSAYTSGAGVQTAEVLSVGGSYGSFTGGYAWSHGAAGAIARIRNQASGSFLWAYINQSSGAGTSVAQTAATGDGAFVQGLLNGGDHTLQAAGRGSFVQGYLGGGIAGIMESTSSGVGGFCQGRSSGGGLLRVSGAGGFTQGNSNGGSITASGAGAFAQGQSGANSITASAVGAFAQGDATTGNILASAAGAVQFGVGSNSLAMSVQIGNAGLRLKGTTGAPGTPQNGDIWVANNYVYIRSNGVSCKCLNANM